MPIHQMLLGIAKGEQFAEATGGDAITTVGDYKVHAFTSSGTFTVTQLGDVNEFEVLLVAGGAGPGTQWVQGGGGGGGIVNHQTGQALTAAAYTVTVGAGGAGASAGTGWTTYFDDGNPGTDSSLKLASNSSIVLEADISDIANLPGMSLPNPQANNKYSWNVYMHSTGGNSAKVVNGVTTQYVGKGGWHQTGYAGGGAGAGEDGDPPNSTSDSTQSYTPQWANGGGCSAGGGGGDGYATTMVTGSTTYYGGGGGAGTGGVGCNGGGSYAHNNFVAPGGQGGGGNGSCVGPGNSSSSGVAAQNGTANTGGAGGGGSQYRGSGNGGSGVVYIKYKFQ